MVSRFLGEIARPSYNEWSSHSYLPPDSPLSARGRALGAGDHGEFHRSTASHRFHAPLTRAHGRAWLRSLCARVGTPLGPFPSSTDFPALCARVLPVHVRWRSGRDRTSSISSGRCGLPRSLFVSVHRRGSLVHDFRRTDVRKLARRCSPLARNAAHRPLDRAHPSEIPAVSPRNHDRRPWGVRGNPAVAPPAQGRMARSTSAGVRGTRARARSPWSRCPSRPRAGW